MKVPKVEVPKGLPALRPKRSSPPTLWVGAARLLIRPPAREIASEPRPGPHFFFGLPVFGSTSPSPAASSSAVAALAPFLIFFIASW